jgi:hypothetical protein
LRGPPWSPVMRGSSTWWTIWGDAQRPTANKKRAAEPDAGGRAQVPAALLSTVTTRPPRASTSPAASEHQTQTYVFRPLFWPPTSSGSVKARLGFWCGRASDWTLGRTFSKSAFFDERLSSKSEEIGGRRLLTEPSNAYLVRQLQCGIPHTSTSSRTASDRGGVFE